VCVCERERERERDRVVLHTRARPLLQRNHGSSRRMDLGALRRSQAEGEGMLAQSLYRHCEGESNDRHKPE
jgi:hypothetical protein